ncbi:MAG: hypothetical protein KME12_23445 [Trichocoleus desertorum ATA4-8-CV12]|jgi:hypothetical protein|nr:hypothetical protein [Trichocoleus desertorum ATA4-8-CV12]
MNLNLSDRVNQRISDNVETLQWLGQVLAEIDELEKIEITITSNEIKVVCADVFLCDQLLRMAVDAGYQRLVSVWAGCHHYGKNHFNRG